MNFSSFPPTRSRKWWIVSVRFNPGFADRTVKFWAGITNSSTRPDIHILTTLQLQQLELTLYDRMPVLRTLRSALAVGSSKRNLTSGARKAAYVEANAFKSLRTGVMLRFH